MTSVGGCVEIRRATASDMEAVAAVLRDAFLEFRQLYTKAAYAENDARSRHVESSVGRRPDLGRKIPGQNRRHDFSRCEAERHIRSQHGGPSVGSRQPDCQDAPRGSRVVCAQSSDGTALPQHDSFLRAAIHLYEDFGFRRTSEPPHDLFDTPLFTMEKNRVE